MSMHRCPHCGNDQLQVINQTNVQTTGKNFSVSQGCLGYLLFGPLGLLCGSCGQGQKTSTTNQTFWACSKCGNKFRDINEQKAEGSKTKTGSILIAVLDVIIAIMSFIAMTQSTKGGVFLLSMAIVLLVFAGFMYAIGNKQLKEAELIEEKMLSFNSNTVNTNMFSHNCNHNSQKFCPQCGEKVLGETKHCTSCGKQIENKIDAKPEANQWKCPNCGKIHANYVGTCGCGEQKPR